MILIMINMYQKIVLMTTVENVQGDKCVLRATVNQ